MSNIEQTLSIIKPDAVERNLESQIKEIFIRNGFKIIESFSNDHLKFFSDKCFFKTELLRIFTNSYIFATDLLNWKFSIFSDTSLIIFFKESITSISLELFDL